MSNAIVSRLFEQWEASAKEGRPIPPESLCVRHPDLLPQLRSLIAARLSGTTPTPQQAQEVTESETDVLAAICDSTTKNLPSVFGTYRVQRVLGAGGMGAVLLAEDAGLGRQVAIKTLKPEYAVRPDARTRFLREARSQAAVEHEHIVAIYAVGEERGIPYLVMPVLRGESLDDRLRREGKQTIAETLRIGREIAEGLAAAHRRGLIHRDIKPANIWLSENEKNRGSVKLLDFGLARIADDSQSNLTASGAVMGTPAYLAPELTDGEKASFKSDLFSFGCVLYQMASGEKPFDGPSVLTILAKLASHTPPPLVERDAAIPVGFSQIVQQLLEKEPSRRPGDASLVAAALRDVECRLALGIGRSSDRLPIAMPAQPTAEIPVALPINLSAEKTVVVRGSTPMPPPRPNADIPTTWEELDSPEETATTAAVPRSKPPTPRSMTKYLLGGGALVLIGVTTALLLNSEKKPDSFPDKSPQADAAPPPVTPPRTPPTLPKVESKEPNKPRSLLTSEDLRIPLSGSASSLAGLNREKLAATESRILPPNVVGMIGSQRGAYFANANARACAPDGKRLACANSAGILLIDSATLQPTTFFPIPDCKSLTFKPDGKGLAFTRSKSPAFGVGFIDLSGAEPRLEPQPRAVRQADPVTAIVFDARNRTFFTGTEAGGIYRWALDPSVVEPLQTILPAKPSEVIPVVKLSLSSAGDRLAAQIAVASDSARIRVFDLSDKEKPAREIGSTTSAAGKYPSIALSPDGTILVIGGEPLAKPVSDVSLWRVGPDQLTLQPPLKPKLRGSVGDFLSDGRTLPIRSATAVSLWEMQPKPRKIHDLPTDTLAIFPTGEKLLTFTQNTLVVREIVGNQELVVGVPEIASANFPVGFGSEIILSTLQRRCYVSGEAGFRPIPFPSELDDHFVEPPREVFIAPKDGRIALVRSRGETAFFHVAKGSLTFEQALAVAPQRPIDSNRINAFAWHPDGRRAAIVSNDNELELLDTSVKPLARTRLAGLNHLTIRRPLAFGHNGDLLATVDENRLLVFDLRTKPPRLHPLPLPPNCDRHPLTALAFHPTGSPLVTTQKRTGDWEYDLTLLNPMPTKYSSASLPLKFAPDGQRTLSVLRSTLTVRKWSGEMPIVLTSEFPAPIRAAEWAADSKHIFVHVDGLIMVLRVP